MITGKPPYVAEAEKAECDVLLVIHPLYDTSTDAVPIGMLSYPKLFTSSPRLTWSLLAGSAQVCALGQTESSRQTAAGPVEGGRKGLARIIQDER